MSIETAAKTTGLYLAKHSPKILTGLSIVGVVATTVSAVKTTSTVVDKINQREDVLTPKELVQEYWKDYIPTATLAATTIASIIGAQSINNKRNVAIASAYALTDNALREYRAQVIETFGEKEARKVNEGLAKKHIDAIPPTNETIIITGEGDSLFRDSLSDRYFKTDIEKVRKAVNDINFVINNDGYASLNDFYGKLGINPTGLGETLGWRSDQLLEVDFYPVMAADGKPCIELQYPKEPLREYYRFH